MTAVEHKQQRTEEPDLGARLLVADASPVQ